MTSRLEHKQELLTEVRRLQREEKLSLREASLKAVDNLNARLKARQAQRHVGQRPTARKNAEDIATPGA